MNQTTSATVARALHPGRLLVATLALALAAGLAQTAAAAPGGYDGGHHPGMMAGPMGGMGDGRHIERMLGAVNATPEQRAQIKPIVEAARADLLALRESGRTLHEQGATLFTQPTVDANAVETLRQQMLAHHDQVSRRMSQAMIEISRVLTPEQRKSLVERMAKRRGMMQHRHFAPDGAKS